MKSSREKKQKFYNQLSFFMTLVVFPHSSNFHTRKIIFLLGTSVSLTPKIKKPMGIKIGQYLKQNSTIYSETSKLVQILSSFFPFQTRLFIFNFSLLKIWLE